MNPASASEVLRASVAGFRRITLRESGDLHETPLVRPVAPPGRDEDGGAWPERMGPFHVSGEIARGGVGVILKARDIDLGRDVALKVLHREHRANPDIIRRFLEEAQIGSQLQHPGIVPVHGMGVLPDGVPYFVMKLVKGRTLAAILEERRDPSDDRQRLLGIFEQVCRTLSYAHARRVIHRDLKPSNIMVGGFGEVQVMDWGLAKVLPREPASASPHAPPSAESIISTLRSGSGSSHSLAGSVLGTPAYMAPEQARGALDIVDARSDVFGLGAILCEILTGRAPYTGESIEEIHRKARKAYLDEAFAGLASCEAAPELVGLDRRCLAFEQRDRPPDAGAVAREVKAHLDSLEQRVRLSSVQAIESAAMAHEERRARKLLLVFSAALLVLFAVAGASLVLLQRERSQRMREADALARTGLQDLQLRLGEARASPGDAHRWATSLAAALEAERRGKGGVSPAMAEDIRSTIDRARSEAAGAKASIDRTERNRRMVSRLEELHLRRIGDRLEAARLNGEYRNAFRAFGIDPEALPAEVCGERVRESGIPLELTAALHDWATSKRILFGEAGAGSRRILDAADAADPDPVRGRLRRAIANISWSHHFDVYRLAGEARKVDLPLATLDLIAEYLRRDTLVKAAAGRLIIDASGRMPDEARPMIWMVPFGKPPHYFPAIAVRPGDVRVISLLAGVLGFRQGNSEAAGLWASEGARLAPDDPETLHVYAMYGPGGRAEEVFARVLEMAPFDSDLRHNYARHLTDIGEPEAAITAYRETLRLERDPTTLNNLGYLLKARGDTEEALSAWTEALRSPAIAKTLPLADQCRIHNEVARILRGKGDLGGAAHHLRRAREVYPPLAWTWFQTGSLCLEQGRTADGLIAYQRGLELDRWAEDLITEAALALDGMRIGSREPAVERALTVLAETIEGAILSGEPLHVLVHGMLLRAHEARLDMLPIDEAREDAERIVKRRRRDIPDLLALRARVARREGDHRAAVSLLEDARRRGGTSPQLSSRLDEARAEVLPDLVTFASIDAALEEGGAIVREGDPWKYFRGKSEPSEGLLWTRADFDDSGWEEGRSGFGYGDDDDATLLADMGGGYTTLYVRKKVDLPSPDDGEKLELRVRSDDGFIAWVNGEEAGRFRAVNVGPMPRSDSRASSTHEAADVDVLDITRFVRGGENTIAILGLNELPGSSDFTLVPEVYRSDRRLLESLREAARGDDAGARLAYMEGLFAARAGRDADALACFERAAAEVPGALEPVERILGILESSGRGKEILGRLDALFAAGLEGARPLLERWVANARATGRSWDALLGAWPGRADRYEMLLLARSAPVSCKYSFSRPPAGWEKPDADDSSWREGPGPFATRGHRGVEPGTVWRGSDVWLRREIQNDFPIAAGPNFRASIVVRMWNDDGAEVYLNGVELVRIPRWTGSYATTVHKMDGVLREGRNVIAVHCHNQDGPGIIDVELGLRIETLDGDPSR